MRVLAVGNMYPPHHFGGYELVWQSAMRNLERHGHEVLVLTTDVDTGAAETDEPNVHRELAWYWHEHAPRPLSRVERIRLERGNARTFDAHVRRFSPDVVSWWSMGGMSLSLIERVRRRDIPAVAFVHDDWLLYAPGVDGWLRPFSARMQRLRPLAERLTGIPTQVDFEHAARYVFVSEATRRAALAAGVALASTGVAHSGIDASFLAPAPERDWSWSLLYVGRIDDRKGIRTAVEALVELPAATLTIVGGWDDREEAHLRRLAHELGVAPRVAFAGKREREEVWAAYADADVVVFPVIWEEPWGLVPIEGMARGRPVVATGRGGSAEYLRDGENALLFEAGDARALATAVARLGDDPPLRRRLVAAGLATAPLYTEDVFNQAVLEELTAAVEAGAGRRTRRLVRA